MTWAYAVLRAGVGVSVSLGIVVVAFLTAPDIVSGYVAFITFGYDSSVVLILIVALFTILCAVLLARLLDIHKRSTWLNDMSTVVLTLIAALSMLVFGFGL